MTTPQTHLQDSQKLTADGLVDLFEITLDAWRNDFDYSNNTKVFIKANNTVIWQGNTYEGIGLRFSGAGNSADEQVSRPAFQVANPDGLFTSLVVNGRLEAALVTRKRVLKTDLDANVNQFQVQTWRVSRIASVTKTIITLELRDQLDGQTFLVPARIYMPPTFPLVSLS